MIFSRRATLSLLCKGLAAPALLRASPAFALAENDLWEPATGQTLDIATVLDRMQAAPEVKLGERHGFAPHQNRTAFLLQALAARGHYPALALEMLEPAQELAVAAYRRDNPEYARALGVALNWSQSGWPEWAFYEPIFQAAFTARLPILAADLPAAERQRYEAEGTPDRPNDPDILPRWQAAMMKAYCNLISEDDAMKLAMKQWKRDLHMAEVLTAHSPAILLAGREHVLPPGGPSLLPEGVEGDYLAIRMGEDVVIWVTGKRSEAESC